MSAVITSESGRVGVERGATAAKVLLWPPGKTQAEALNFFIWPIKLYVRDVCCRFV